MRTIEDDLGELHFGGGVLSGSRRRFTKRMAAGGAIAFGSTLIPIASMMPAALAEDTTGSSPGTTATSTAEPKVQGSDLQIAIFSETVELAAVALYNAALATGLLTSGVAEVGKLFAGHHSDHAGQFAAFAGKASLGVANQKLVDELTPKLKAAKTEQDILKLARDVEEGAAATYVYALGALQSKDAAAAVATILPVESQHSIALSFAIDGTDDAFVSNVKTNLPNFETANLAFDPKKYAAS
jgi:hypothetical protein